MVFVRLPYGNLESFTDSVEHLVDTKTYLRDKNITIMSYQRRRTKIPRVTQEVTIATRNTRAAATAAATEAESEAEASRNNGASGSLDIIEVAIRQEHSSAVRQTEDFCKKQKTVQDHNRRLMQMIEWIKTEYPAYYEEGIRELNDEQKADNKRYYKSTHDFVYNKLSPDIVKAFICAKAKYRGNSQTQYSFSHTRKFQDAILYGAWRARESLPEKYELEMNVFLDSTRKEKVQAKKKGEFHEQEADPISFELYRQICKFALDDGDIFVWAFTVLQWNCMARSKNIDDLTFDQLSMGTDSLIIEYDDSKCDQMGQRTSPKNCYANPYDHLACIFTAIGCYLCLEDETWVSSSQNSIFRNRRGEVDGDAAHQYCARIRKIYEKQKETFDEYTRKGHFNPHGTRKGAAIRASSGTTLPASLAAIANRGEWKVSMMFEMYLGFAEPGDQYLGRLLAGLSPNCSSFACIPPHFEEGMENPLIKEAMQLCYGSILKHSSYMNAILLRCLASITHHSKNLLQYIERDTSSPLANIPILTRSPTLLFELQKLVRLHPTDRITIPTGIPPHVEIIGNLEKMIDLLLDHIKVSDNLVPSIKDAVGEKLEEMAVSQGQMTRPAIENILDQFGSKIQHDVVQEVKELLKTIRPESQQNNANNIEGHLSNDILGGGFQLYSYQGRFWQVPEDFDFPDGTKRRRAWELWLCGMTINNQRIPPFRLLKPTMLPKKLEVKFKTSWLPILTKMDETPGLLLPSSVDSIDSKFIDESYATVTSHLKSNVCSFLFGNNKDGVIDNWTVGTWSKRVQRNYVMQHGTESDKANLAPFSTQYNMPHRAKRLFTKKH